jgi:hypothetical protein
MRPALGETALGADVSADDPACRGLLFLVDFPLRQETITPFDEASYVFSLGE